jgi:hypothetical protein
MPSGQSHTHGDAGWTHRDLNGILDPRFLLKEAASVARVKAELYRTLLHTRKALTAPILSLNEQEFKRVFSDGLVRRRHPPG